MKKNQALCPGFKNGSKERENFLLSGFSALCYGIVSLPVGHQNILCSFPVAFNKKLERQG